MYVLNVDQPGDNSTLEFQERPIPEPAAEQVLIRVYYTALNRADLLQMRGRYPIPHGVTDVPGLEAAGVVEKTGSNVEGVQEGDRVCALLDGGGYAEFALADHKTVIPVDHKMDLREASAIPEVFLTAWQALFWLGELKEQENVLIHAGASGVGTASIQLARVCTGSNIAVTASSDHKLQECASLGADLLINYRQSDFADTINREWGSAKANLVIDFIGAPYWKQNLDVLAMDGRMVMLAMLGGVKQELAIGKILRKRLTIRGSTLRNRSVDYKRKLTADFTKNAMGRILSGEIQPVIDREYDWSDAEAARRYMAGNQNIGKVILRVRD